MVAVWASLAGIVLFYQGPNPSIHIAKGLAGINSGHSKVGVPLNFLPVGFEFVLVAQFVEQSC